MKPNNRITRAILASLIWAGGTATLTSMQWNSDPMHCKQFNAKRKRLWERCNQCCHGNIRSWSIGKASLMAETPNKPICTQWNVPMPAPVAPMWSPHHLFFLEKSLPRTQRKKDGKGELYQCTAPIRRMQLWRAYSFPGISSNPDQGWIFIHI